MALSVELIQFHLSYRDSYFKVPLNTQQNSLFKVSIKKMNAGFLFFAGRITSSTLE